MGRYTIYIVRDCLGLDIAWYRRPCDSFHQVPWHAVAALTLERWGRLGICLHGLPHIVIRSQQLHQSCMRHAMPSEVQLALHMGSRWLHALQC